MNEARSRSAAEDLACFFFQMLFEFEMGDMLLKPLGSLLPLEIVAKELSHCGLSNLSHFRWLSEALVCEATE